jgi:hypothetical protein
MIIVLNEVYFTINLLVYYTSKVACIHVHFQSLFPHTFWIALRYWFWYALRATVNTLIPL